MNNKHVPSHCHPLPWLRPGLHHLQSLKSRLSLQDEDTERDPSVSDTRRLPTAANPTSRSQTPIEGYQPADAHQGSQAAMPFCVSSRPW
jgi:citrate synthase